MNQSFGKRVHGAAMAGWKTLLVGVIFLSITWFAFVCVNLIQPSWLLYLYGPGLTWSYIDVVALWLVGIFKVCLWLAALVVLWLTLWARQLQKDEAAQ
ncbi:MAG TPA: hypothetical protein VFE62_06330 [Gemmataceae bacterium]|nr:hypothetical protein [Gemmataceae bacterium]